MSFAITYPANDGQGATANNRLITACGTFDDLPEGEPYTIFGKVYLASSPPTDAMPPSGASSGTCILGAVVNTWHFNGCAPPLDGCTIGQSHILRVWIAPAGTPYYLHRDAEFTACDAGDASCSINCPDVGGGMQSMQLRTAGPVIAESAARYFDVVPAADVSAVLQFFGAPTNDLSKLKVRLSYDESRSSLDRAVWSAEAAPGEQLRLEVTTGSCCARATLARLRVGEDVVQVLERWTADYFDLLDGGTLEGGKASGGQRTGSVRVMRAEKTPPGGTTRAAKKSAKKPAQSSKQRSETVNRRQGRGR